MSNASESIRQITPDPEFPEVKVPVIEDNEDYEDEKSTYLKKVARAREKKRIADEKRRQEEEERRREEERKRLEEEKKRLEEEAEAKRLEDERLEKERLEKEAEDKRKKLAEEEKARKEKLAKSVEARVFTEAQLHRRVPDESEQGRLDAEAAARQEEVRRARNELFGRELTEIEQRAESMRESGVVVKRFSDDREALEKAARRKGPTAKEKGKGKAHLTEVRIE